MASRKAFYLLAACLLFAACGEEGREPDVNDVIAPGDKGTGVEWLRAADRIEPALWLASREAGRTLEGTDRSVDRMRAALLSARARFLESDRMLANRTAQIGKMLADDGRPEDYAELLGALADVAGGAGQKQTYGQLCQHYVNLRRKGVARDDALRLLAERYQTQRQFR